MREIKTKHGTAMFIHNLVTNCIGYSNPLFTQKKPRHERKKIGKTISKTFINTIIFQKLLN
tara:strand:+ start:303 stop:485 length:183 start_codon:yes stop_codon:yes gene_type:complete